MVELPHLIQGVSYAGIFGIVVAEFGLLAGFFLPGDSLPITAGQLARQGSLNVPGVGATVAAGAILGDSAGYAIGRSFGPTVFCREGSRWLRPESVQRTETFFNRHGSRALILARIVPVVRTIAPTMAGVGGMPYSKVLTYNVIGGVLWALGVPLLGYTLGSLIPNLDRYILLLVGVVVVLSFIPVALEVRRARMPAKEQA